MHVLRFLLTFPDLDAGFGYQHHWDTDESYNEEYQLQGVL